MKEIKNLIILLLQEIKNKKDLQVIIVKIIIISKIEIRDLEGVLEIIIIVIIGKDWLHNYFLNVSVTYMLKQIK